MRRALRFAIVLCAFLASCVPGASARQAADFVPVESITAAPLPEDLLFFPLDDSFQSCIPLAAPCPDDSSTVMLVPASRRRLAWRSEATDLREYGDPTPPVRAIGDPPDDPETARYLVPVLNGGGVDLAYAHHRLDSGRLVPVDTATAAPVRAVTPVLTGSLLSTAAPSPDAPDRVLSTPVLIGAGEITDATPVLLARRAAPSRVVFGIRADPQWQLSVEYVALLDEDVIAFAGRRQGVVGIAVRVPVGLRVAQATESDGTGEQEGDDSGAGDGTTSTGAVAAGVGAVLAAGLTIVVLRLRRSRRDAGRS